MIYQGGGGGERNTFKFETVVKKKDRMIFHLFNSNLVGKLDYLSVACVSTIIFLLCPFCFLAQGEIEAIVVPVCLAFLLTTLLGVLFCFNKRDL